jgi:hypothetical protein
MIFFTSSCLAVVIVTLAQLMAVSNIVPSTNALPVPQQAFVQDINMDHSLVNIDNVRNVSLERRFVSGFAKGIVNKAKEVVKKAPETIRKAINKNPELAGTVAAKGAGTAIKITGSAVGLGIAAVPVGDLITKVSEKKFQRVAEKCSQKGASISCVKT